MKSFTQFLSEASAASAQALKLNLKSDGHGGWYNNRGEFVAKTEQGKLKFYGKNQKPGEKDEPRTQKASVAQPIAKPKAAAFPESGTGTTISALISFSFASSAPKFFRCS